RVQTGFVVGGPLGHRTQFFAGVEYQGINAATEQHFSTPTRAERNFEFQQDVNGTLTFGVLKPSTLFPGNVFFGTTQGTTPLGRNVLLFYPLPNNPAGPYGANTYSQILRASGHGTVSSFKLTHEISPRNSLSGRYDFTNDNRILPSVNEAINSTIGSHTRTHNLALILDTALTASV